MLKNVWFKERNYKQVKNKPKDYDKYVKKENKILLLFERIGEMLVTCISLISYFSCSFFLEKIKKFNNFSMLMFYINDIQKLLEVNEWKRKY